MNNWSSQIIAKTTYNIGDEKRTGNVLIVCNRNHSLFNEKFLDGNHWPKEDLTRILPFDFICLGGVPCPRGQFYEVEYTLGSKYGTVHRALIQAVRPEEDLQLIIGALKHQGILPADIVTHKAYHCDDIDAVRIVECYHDEDIDDTVISGVHITPRDEEYSILDTVIGRDPSAPFMAKGAVCLEYYASDHCVEVWLDPDDKFECKPIFVCGSSNVWDEAFAEQRREDLAELQDHIDDAIQLLNEYGLQYLICYENSQRVEGTDRQQVNLMNRCVPEFATAIADYLVKKKD